MKKKNTIIHIINWCLLFSLPLMLLTVKVDTDTINSLSDTKKLSTSLFSQVEEVTAVKVDTEVKEEEEIPQEIVEEKVSSQNEEKVDSSSKKIEEVVEEKEEIKTEVVEKKEEESVPVVSDVLASYTGKMSFYNANCAGCSGITSTGVDVSDGRIYYQDSKYGQVRIVAAGTEIKKWSIIRIKNSSLGSNVLAIVLDRGGNIGVGRKFLIDMLTNSSEGRGGVQNNITVEVLRSGK